MFKRNRKKFIYDYTSGMVMQKPSPSVKIQNLITNSGPRKKKKK